MTRERIEKAAKEAVQDHFQCNGKYPCEERNYCEFCNGHNSAFDCNEDCGADEFNEGFIAGAQWRINSVWHNSDEEPEERKKILVEYRFMTPDGEIEVRKEVVESLDDLSDIYCDVLHWAYLDDLLPERKEETE